MICSRLAKWQDLATRNANFLSSARFRPLDFEFFHNGDRIAVHLRNPKPGEPSDYITEISGGPDGQDDGTE